ncbi:DUF4166 domain-containing protein [Sediminivirga luteola]|uniref:DUF4166 domain-containing protein n=1 Tax=Sediminivirga luteola TaxID=1774748 RepID=A0A8J2TWE2_9MICO|nr:DUF4166 domain-containing protein [Sediminivirga luteola]GGA08074.1 hypothetical protein GCM10011333_08600 [Sediminivirga luteola]
MTSIFRAVLGDEFERLHPQLQRRFSVGLTSDLACLGRGVMEEIWHGPPWVRPFLALGGTRNILAPRRGRQVPFTIENVPYLDTHGRETVTFVRTFRFPGRSHRFDAQMVLAPGGGHIVDYLGTHQHLVSDLHPAVDHWGGLIIRSGAHRFIEGPVDIGVPELIGADATVRESFDDEAGCFRIQVNVVNRRFGPLFGYHGAFRAEFTEASRLGVRPGLRPVREVALP